MRSTPTYLALCAVLPPLLAGCELSTGPEAPEEITELPRSLTTAEQEVLAASNEFGFELLGRISAADPESNLFVSPLSAHMALGMALSGADDETFDAMRETLAFAETKPDSIDASYRSLIGLLRGLDPAVEFLIGNSMWYKEGFPFLPSYMGRMEESYDARVEGLDFGDQAAALEAINGWVDESTNGKIEKILKRIRPDEIAFLVNAIYFEGDWTHRFDPEETREADFRLKDGSTAPVELMHREGELPFARTENWTAVEIPYGGKAFAMTVILPRGETGIDEFLSSLDGERWAEIVRALEGTGETRPLREIDLLLPKFELEWDGKLKDVLSDMGMRVAFDREKADFGRMVDLAKIRPNNVFLTRVKQKSFVSVDEIGTEAAAATAVGVGADSAPPRVLVDRPFLFAIRERLSGTVLFLGKIVRPPAS